jgi:hypothetical protein
MTVDECMSSGRIAKRKKDSLSLTVKGMLVKHMTQEEKHIGRWNQHSHMKASCKRHNKTRERNCHGELYYQGELPFVIDVKGGEKDQEHNHRGSMSVSINDKGGDC